MFSPLEQFEAISIFSKIIYFFFEPDTNSFVSLSDTNFFIIL